MHTGFWPRSSGRALGVMALAIALVGVVLPTAEGVTPGPNPPTPGAATGQHRGVLRTIMRVERDFTVAPHSLAINQILPCPRRTQLTGGGTTLIGEPSSPHTAPVVYTNGPVGTLLAGGEQSWASEVANASDETFTYRQFALCASSQHQHQP